MTLSDVEVGNTVRKTTVDGIVKEFIITGINHNLYSYEFSMRSKENPQEHKMIFWLKMFDGQKMKSACGDEYEII